MKQLTLCILTLFFGFSAAFAQPFYHQSKHNHYTSYSPYLQDENGEHFWLNLEFAPGSQEDKKMIENRLNNKLKTISKTSLNSKGEKNYTYTHTFNEMGRITQTQRYFHKKDKYATTILTYLNDSIIKGIETINYKGKKNTYDYSYIEHDGKFLLTSVIITKNGTVKEKLIIQRNQKGKILSRKEFYGKDLKKTSETRNEYNSSGDIIKTSFYFKEKLESVYNYDCNPEGKKEIDKKVEVSDVCKWTEERNDGSYIVYSRSTSEKKNYLNVYEYRSDSTLFCLKRFLNDSLLVVHNTFQKNASINISYSDKQKMTWSSLNIYDDNHNLLQRKYESHSFLNNYSYLTINEYKNNNVVKTISSRKGHKASVWTYEYNDKGLKVNSSLKIGGKSKKNNSYLFEYSFY